MFEKPEAFNKFILGGPVFKRGNIDLFEIEENYRKQKNYINAKVYTAKGSQEGIKGWEQFVDILRSRNYENLKLEAVIIDGETHYTSIPTIFLKGLQYIFCE